MRKAAITMCGLGYLPVAPGTWGSAGATAVWMVGWTLVYLLGRSSDAGPQWLWLNMATATAIFFACIGSVHWGDWAIEAFGRKDPKQFVLDEGAGQWIALLFMPATTPVQMLVVAAGQFFAFRLFDIVKPPPARQAEALPAGWGVLLDDVISGAYVLILGQVVYHLAFPTILPS